MLRIFIVFPTVKHGIQEVSGSIPLGDGEGGAVCVAGSSPFDNFDLDGVKGEDFQGKADLMAAAYAFTIVGIDEFPLVSPLTGEGFNGKGKFVNALSKRLRWYWRWLLYRASRQK